MRDYIHWATLGALCELLPQPDNRVTLADETDRHGLPVAHFSYTQCDNDRSSSQPPPTSWRICCARPAPTRSSPSSATPTSSAAAAWRAAPRTASSTPTTAVFAVPKLYVVDGSVLPTQGSANPALTIMALAARAADLMTRHAARS